MAIWAIADLHLSFGVEGKKMDVFGPKWVDHASKIEKNWKSSIANDDLVLIAGDISWALHQEDAMADLEWIENLPGTKVMIKGNHDLWWRSASKVRKVLPNSIHLVQNDAFTIHGVTIGGTRLWENPLISYNEYIEFREVKGVNIHKKENTEEERLHDEKIFKTELDRLTTSIAAMDSNAKHRIVMVHYPPAGPLNRDSVVMDILAKNRIDVCLFGHLHNLKQEAPVNFSYKGVRVLCTACDYLDFKPVLVEF